MYFDDASNNETLEAQRRAVCDDLGPIPEVTVDFMLEYIIPNYNIDLKATLRQLKKADVWSEGSGWKVLEGQSPKDLTRKKSAVDSNQNPEVEMRIFCRLMKDIYDSIISSVRFCDQSSREPTLLFGNSHSTTDSDTSLDFSGALTTGQDIHTTHLNITPPTRNDDYDLPDAPASHTKLGQGGPKWFNVACPGRYKVNNSPEDLNDNASNMIWDLHTVMRVDHRRRFIFGITADNEDARIWFACRQIVFVTQPFNFNKDASQLVHLIASLAYAAPTQLGYDPTIKLQWRNNGFHYDIECITKSPDGLERTLMYYTEKILSDTAYNLRGRATRVYLATTVYPNDLSSPSSLFALKDCWIDASRPREGDTYSRLLEGASEEEKRLFLAVHQHGVVQIEDQDDSTEGLILKGQKIELTTDRKPALTPMNPFLKRIYDAQGETIPSCEHDWVEKVDLGHDVGIFHWDSRPAFYARSSISQTSISDSDSVLNRPVYTLRRNAFQRPTVYAPKVHYRIVFADVGDSLKQLAGSGKVTIKILDRIMSDITKALRYAAKKGYIHRDISAGNILWFGDHAKLSDLEFAQEFDMAKSSYSRAGTYNFMAGEAMNGEYSVKKYAKQNAAVPFVLNPIHDLESLWWVAVWCTMWHYPAPFKKIVHPPQHGDYSSDSQIEYQYRDFNETERRHIEVIRTHGRQLFPPSPACFDTFRMEEIHHPVRYSSRAQNEYPKALTTFTFCLYGMKQCISWAYTRIQSDLPRTQASYFTDVLRVADPTTVITDDDTVSCNRMPVYDRVLQIFGMLREHVDIDDAILWPLDSLDQYSHWLQTQQTERNGNLNI